MVEVNCIGQKCPLPLIHTKKAIVENPNTSLKILVDNETSCSNLKSYLQDNGIEFNVLESNGSFAIITGDASKITLKEVDPYCNTNKQEGFIVIFDSNIMGTGNSDLGKLLIKGFLTALSEHDEKPTEIICYNSGVLLAENNTETANYLKKILEMGVRVKLCGTCLDFYGIQNNIAVGEITNMFYILQKLTSNCRIIKPC